MLKKLVGLMNIYFENLFIKYYNENITFNLILYSKSEYHDEIKTISKEFYNNYRIV